MASLRLATWNINGLAPNKEEIEQLIRDHQLDVVLVSETHCTDSSNVKLRGFQTYLTNHPDGTGHAGTAVIIKSSIKHNVMQEFKTNHIQATTVAISDKCGHLNLSAIYCPPRHTITEPLFTQLFEHLGKRFVAGGDWNSKHT